MNTSYLRSVMVSESKAYGFTIAFWGSGLMLVDNLGFPGLSGALLYGLGAVVGFGVLAVFAFRGGEAEQEELLVFSTIHYLSALAPVISTWVIAQGIDHVSAFFIAGANVSLIYNLLMLVEKKLADEGIVLERRIEEALG